MRWTVEFAKGVEKDLRRLGADQRMRVVSLLSDRISDHPDPRSLAKKLYGAEYEGLWRFRVGDLRLIAEFHDDRLIVMILTIKNRGKVYR